MPAPTPGRTLDIANFTVGGMLRAGLALRQVVRDASSLEEAADLAVRYLYDNCVDPATGQRTCALVRFYKTHALGQLEPSVRHIAEQQLDGVNHDDALRCLTLLGTVGDEQSWSDRHASKAHQAIPLPSADIVRRAPMIARLIEQLGLEIQSVIDGGAPAQHTGGGATYDVFHVEDALGSPHIPAQAEFVVRYGIASVVGFGGLLRSGELFAIIIFCRTRVSAASAARFRTIALDVRSALYSLGEEKTWKADR